MEKEILFELAEKLSKYDWKVGGEIGKLVFVRVSGESERYSYFEKGCREKAKKRTRQSREVIWDMINEF